MSHLGLIIFALSVLLFFVVGGLRMHYRQPKYVALEVRDRQRFSSPSELAKLKEAAQYGDKLGIWSQQIVVVFTLFTGFFATIFTISWFFAVNDSGEPLGYLPILFLDVITVWLIIFLIRDHLKKSTSCYRESGTYCVLQHGRVRRRLEFADIAKWQVDIRYGSPHSVQIVDVRGQEFFIDFAEFDPLALIEYLGYRDTEQFSQRQLEAEVLLGYRNYLFLRSGGAKKVEVK